VFNGKKLNGDADSLLANCRRIPESMGGSAALFSRLAPPLRMLDGLLAV
jgi:hypothetical protein